MEDWFAQLSSQCDKPFWSTGDPYLLSGVFGKQQKPCEFLPITPDDKAFFPSYDLTPYVRKEVLDKYPEIEDILNELVATFPGGGEPATFELVAEGQKVWQELNAKVSIDGIKPDDVARDYLVKHKLVKE